MDALSVQSHNSSTTVLDQELSPIITENSALADSVAQAFRREAITPHLDAVPEVAHKDAKLTELAIRLHVRSRPLLALPPLELWSRDKKDRWLEALFGFTKKLDRVLDLFNANPSFAPKRTRAHQHLH